RVRPGASFWQRVGSAQVSLGGHGPDGLHAAVPHHQELVKVVGHHAGVVGDDVDQVAHRRTGGAAGDVDEGMLFGQAADDQVFHAPDAPVPGQHVVPVPADVQTQGLDAAVQERPAR